MVNQDAEAGVLPEAPESRQARPPKNHPDVTESTSSDTLLQPALHTRHHVVTSCIVSSCCSSHSHKAYPRLKAIGHSFTPSFRRYTPPDPKRLARKQLQQMAVDKVCRR